jgi:hypothetical protein
MDITRLSLGNDGKLWQMRITSRIWAFSGNFEWPCLSQSQINNRGTLCANSLGSHNTIELAESLCANAIMYHFHPDLINANRMYLLTYYNICVNDTFVIDDI